MNYCIIAHHTVALESNVLGSIFNVLFGRRTSSPHLLLVGQPKALLDVLFWHIPLAGNILDLVSSPIPWIL